MGVCRSICRGKGRRHPASSLMSFDVVANQLERNPKVNLMRSDLQCHRRGNMTVHKRPLKDFFFFVGLVKDLNSKIFTV